MQVKKFLGPYKDLPGSIYIIFFARIVNSMGNFVMPFLTIFLTDHEGYTKLEAGKFVMIAAMFYALGTIIGGKVCDHAGRKKMLIIFQGLSASILLLCAFKSLNKIIPYLLILAGFFVGAAGPPQTAMVTDLTDRENRKPSFSFLYLGNNIGFALGPMIAGFLYRRHLPFLFVADALTTIASLILVWLYVKETLPHGSDIKRDGKGMDYERAEVGSVFSAILKRPRLVTFSLIMIIYSLVYAQYTFSLPIQINEIFKYDGPKIFGILMTVNALTVVFITPFITNATLKYEPIFPILLGGIQYAIGFGMIYFIDTIPLFMISTVAWTAGEILNSTNTGVYIANNTPISHRGRFSAFLYIISGTGYAFGPYVTGWFIDVYGIKNVWIMCFLLSILSSSLIGGLIISSKRAEGHKKSA